ncbi:MAG: hypothetical protein WBN39_14440 [Flavobacteriaceae bacterium]
MKTRKTLLLMGCLGSMALVQAQTEPKASAENTNNFLDIQAAGIGDIFSEEMTGRNGEINNYLDLVNKSDMPEADKQNLRDVYRKYSQALDAQGKDSLQTALSKQLLTAKKDTLK